MSQGAWTAIVAVIGVLGAMVTGGFAFKASDRARVLTVDRAIYDSMREDFRAAKEEIRELEKNVDAERRKRRQLEDAVHRIARALYAAGIPIPAEVSDLLSPPNTQGGSG